MKKTIYVPDGFDWDGLKDRASEAGVSVSTYILNAASDVVLDTAITDALGRIERKLNELLKIGEPVEMETGVTGNYLSDEFFHIRS